MFYFKRKIFENVSPQININSKTFLPNLDEQIKHLVKNKDSQLSRYYLKYIKKLIPIEKAYKINFSYVYWLEDSDENIQHENIELSVVIKDFIDIKLMTLNDLDITRILNFVKDKYHNKILNKMSQTFKWRPTLEVVANHLFDELHSYSNLVKKITISIYNQSVEVKNTSQNKNLLDICITMGATI